MTESSKQRPREFWILTKFADKSPVDRDMDRLCLVYSPEPEGEEEFVHVIEASFAEELEAKLAVAVKALEFYASQDQWSCRLRSKYEGDRLKWYDEAENYFQDPYDLKAMHDMGKAATEALEQIKQMKEGL